MGLTGRLRFSDEIAEVSLYAVFRSDVPEEQRAAVQRDAPPPVASFAWLLPNLLLLGSDSDEYFDTKIWKVYGPDPQPLGVEPDDADEIDLDEYEDPGGEVTKEQAQAFCDAMDSWLLGVHEEHPLVVVLGWIGKSRRDPWAKWSASVALERAVPALLTIQEQLAKEWPDDYFTRRKVSRLIYDVLVNYFDHNEWANVEPEMQETVKRTLLGLRGVDDDLDYNVRYLFRLLTGEVLPKRYDGTR